MIITSKQTNNSIYPSKKIGSIDIYDKSTENITLDYFLIINKIFNNSLEKCYNHPIEKKESAFSRSSSCISQINSGFTKEPYKEKSFFEKVSFFFSTAKEALRISKIDTQVDFINTTTHSTLKKIKHMENHSNYENYKDKIDSFLTETQNEVNKTRLNLFKEHPEYKQLKDEFDRLHDERTAKIEQMNKLVFELNNYRQFILDEYNPIVLKLLDLSQEIDTDFKMQYMDIVKKLYQKIDYIFKFLLLKEIIKSDVLFKWDDLKNNVEVLEKDNQALDIEISKIINNHFFSNFKNKDFKYFEPIKTKLASIIKEKEEKIESQNKKSGSKQELEDLINSIDEKEKILEEKKISKEIQLQKSKLEKLKKELKTLELKLQELVEQKTEYLNDIEEFNHEYNLHLGELIKDILNLKKEILYKQTIKQQKEKEKYQEDIQTFEDTKETIDELKSTISELEDALDSIDEDDENYKELSEAYNELKEELEKLEVELELQEEELEKTKEFIDDETIEQEYEEVNSQYEEFENEYEHIKESVQNSLILNDEEKKELKLLYKKAARICHPDIVHEELKEKAHDLMQKLNDAYSKKDIVKVKEILHSLQNGTSFEVSSDTIDDSELLIEKIKEYKKNILELENEIEDLKHDETYQTIQEIDDMDVYFEELKSELQNEKDRLEEESKGILENTKENTLDKNVEKSTLKCPSFELENYDELSFFIEKWIKQELSKKDVNVDIVTKSRIKESSKQVASELISNKISNVSLPFLITNSGKIENFYIDNVTYQTIQEIDDMDVYFEELKSELQNEKDRLEEEAKDIGKNTKEKSLKKTTSKNKAKSKIEPEASQYSKHIHSIENIRFERIRKYCENLSKENNADTMQEYLAENGRMYKAIMYSTLEVLMENLNEETITLYDWGCNQGIASMLVLDYIKEKQLDTKVFEIVLIDDDTKALSRAIAQVEALAQDSIKYTAIKSDDNKILDNIESSKNNIILNLFANDKIPENFLDLDYNIFDESYFLCVSNENKEFVDEVYKNMNNIMDIQDMSILDGKIGRYNKYERIFKAEFCEIPF